ncbi:MAG: hypothetical protein AVDCRST_MAG32-2074, partial [uncultured Nocardioides sp.]
CSRGSPGGPADGLERAGRARPRGRRASGPAAEAAASNCRAGRRIEFLVNAGTPRRGGLTQASPRLSMSTRKLRMVRGAYDEVGLRVRHFRRVSHH